LLRRRGFQSLFTVLLLLIGDVAALVAALAAAYLVRLYFPFSGKPLHLHDVFPLAATYVLVTVFALAAQGLYPAFGLTSVKELERLVTTLTVVAIVVGAVALLNGLYFLPRSVWLLAWLFSLVFLPVERLGLRSWMGRFKWYGVPVALIGNELLAGQIARGLVASRRLGWRPVGVFSPTAWEKIPPDVDVVILVLGTHEMAALNGEILRLNARFRRVILAETWPHLGSLWIEPRDLAGRLGIEFRYYLFSRTAQVVKRTVDLALALGGLVALSPFLGIIALAIRLDSPGPVIFRQERLGRAKTHFGLLKFRTMVVDAERHLEELLARDPRLREEYEHFHKLSRDPRVTRVGRWLRKFGLDELPQLWNVLRGEMSMVGPRPYLPSELGDMGESADIILRVRPGITGWWQVLGRNDTTFRQRLAMDVYYISNWSLWMDAYIFLKTVVVFLRGTGK